MQTSRIFTDTACQSIISNLQSSNSLIFYSNFPVTIAIFNSPIACVI